MDGGVITGGRLGVDDPVQFVRDLGVPGWVIATMIVVVVLGVFVGQVQKLGPAFSALAVLGRRLRIAERRRERVSRQHFARSLAAEIQRLNDRDGWSTTEFLDLDLELEMVRTHSLLRRFFDVEAPALRVGSLQSVFKVTDDRIILLHGDPGCGKTITLRSTAFSLARKAAQSKDPGCVLPVYVNLREWRPESQDQVTAATVRAFVQRSLNPAENPQVAKFLDDNFNSFLISGRWLFLFDSFDEIPALLGAAEYSAEVHDHRDAIVQFATTFNSCRVVVASRDFRGPATYGLYPCKIQPLTTTQQLGMVARASISNPARDIIRAALVGAEPGIGPLLSNPLFFSLICQHVQATNEFPKSARAVFENYLTRRLDRDAPALRERFDLGPADVLSAAESIALALNASANLGLTATVQEISDAIRARGIEIDRLEAVLESLVYLRLLRNDPDRSSDVIRLGFTHRRFQEYLASRVVVCGVTWIKPYELLFNYRWRESAVAVIQFQPLSTLKPIFDTAVRKLQSYLGRPDILWTPQLLHLLGILDAGLSMRGESIARVERRVDEILSWTAVNGSVVEKKWAIDVAGAASASCRSGLYRAAFDDRSRWLRMTAFDQLGRLSELPADIGAKVRKTYFYLATRRQLRSARAGIDVQIKRLGSPPELAQPLRYLGLAGRIDTVLVCAFLVAVDFVPAILYWFQYDYILSDFDLQPKIKFYGEAIVVRLFELIFVVAIRYGLLFAFCVDYYLASAGRRLIVYYASSIWACVLFLRITVFVGAITYGPDGILAKTFAALFGSYVLLWCPSAYLAIARGRVLDGLDWLLLPVWLARQVAESLDSFVAARWPQWSRTRRVGAISMIAIGAVAAVVCLHVAFGISQHIGSDFEQAMTAAFTVAMGVPASYLLICAIHRGLRNLIIRHRAFESKSSSWDVDRMVEAVRATIGLESRARIVERVRSAQLLYADAETVTQLSEALREADDLHRLLVQNPGAYRDLPSDQRARSAAVYAVRDSMGRLLEELIEAQR